MTPYFEFKKGSFIREFSWLKTINCMAYHVTLKKLKKKHKINRRLAILTRGVTIWSRNDNTRLHTTCLSRELLIFFRWDIDPSPLAFTDQIFRLVVVTCSWSLRIFRWKIFWRSKRNGWKFQWGTRVIFMKKSRCLT